FVSAEAGRDAPDPPELVMDGPCIVPVHCRAVRSVAEPALAQTELPKSPEVAAGGLRGAGETKRRQYLVDQDGKKMPVVVRDLYRAHLVEPGSDLLEFC